MKNFKVKSNALSRPSTNPTYKVSANPEATPLIRYTRIIKTITMRNPIKPAIKLVEIASCPNLGPTTLERSSFNSKGREPIRIVAANLSAASQLPYVGLVLGLLNAFDLTLTLPGIAGIVLSIGMAVDANVIIFARIREEIGAGKTVRSAINEGFKKAMSAILDGNITTIIENIICIRFIDT